MIGFTGRLLLICGSFPCMQIKGGIPIQTQNIVPRRTFAKKKQKQSKMILLAGAAAAVLLLLFAVAGIFLMRNDETEAAPVGKLPKNVTIGGIQVGGMTAGKAREAILAQYPGDIESTDMILDFPNRKHTLSPKDTKVHWDIESALEQAAASEPGTEIDLELKLDSEYIRQRIDSILDALGGAYIPSGFRFEGEIPDFSDENAVTQTLILEKGRPGIDLDPDRIYADILTAYQVGSFRVSIKDFGDILEPKPLDLDDVYTLVYSAPVEPVLDRENMTATPGQNGYGFDLEDAKAQLSELSFGESASIPCYIIHPKLSDDDVYFQDVLGNCRTPHTDNENRNENLRLACSMIDGMILQPGDVISYNEALGPRTAEKGYKPAPAYSGVELVNEIGGGICQVSSTLYLASLLSELKIVNRVNHGFPVDYIPIGLDATVNWGTTDLKIKNSYDFPIKIHAEVDDTHVTVQILGIDKRDYYVRIQHVVEGPRYASAYMCHYDKVTGKEIYKALDHASLYLDVVWQWPDYADNDRIVTYR